ncbi:DnaJ (Hsp40), sub C, member 17 [Dimargaris cristalligena]|nr:DnaJ (Hsp40), sub C, member 17 [Dimargaris cristalligena]
MADHYEMLGISLTSTAKEITKAYRVRALRLHPDKNPNDPTAAQRFHELTIAYETLTDATKKQDYDDTIRAKQARQQKHADMDLKRRAMKEELERAERQARERYQQPPGAPTSQYPPTPETASARRAEGKGGAGFRTTPKRDKAPKPPSSGTRLAADDEERILRQYSLSDGIKEIDRSIVARWKRGLLTSDTSTIGEPELQAVFRTFGPIDHIIMSDPNPKKSPSALIVYRSIISAYSAMTSPTHSALQPFKIRWATGTQPAVIDKIIELTDQNDRPVPMASEHPPGQDAPSSPPQPPSPSNSPPPAPTEPTCIPPQPTTTIPLPTVPPSFSSFPSIGRLPRSTPSASTTSTTAPTRPPLSGPANISLDDYETLTFMNLKKMERRKLADHIRRHEEAAVDDSTFGATPSSTENRENTPSVKEPGFDDSPHKRSRVFSASSFPSGPIDALGGDRKNGKRTRVDE